MKKVVIFTVSMLTFASIFLAGPAKAEWQNEAALGYTNTNGNTDKSSFSLSGQMKNIMDEAEFLLKGDLFIGSSNNKQDSKNWNALARYFYDFGNDNRYFNSYQVNVEHDRFANIDYRITPSIGVGYHIFRESDNNGMKWMAEVGLGYQITEYRTGTPSDEDEIVAIIHTNFEKKVFEKGIFSEDLTLTPSLEESGMLIRSETAFTNPINESVDLRLRYIIDHDTDPVAGTKKTDTQIITDIRYKF